MKKTAHTKRTPLRQKLAKSFIFSLIAFFVFLSQQHQNDNVRCAFAASSATPSLIDDFERATSPSPWVFDNGAEFPGATGSLTSGPGYTGEGAHLAFDLSKGGRYVSANLSLSTPVVARALGFRVKRPAGVVAHVRVIDSTNQTLQYYLTRPFEASDPSAWYYQTVQLNNSTEHWSGANDAIVHYPIREIDILAEPADETLLPTSAIAFDDVAWLDLADQSSVGQPIQVSIDPASQALPVHGVDYPLDQLGVNIHFTNNLQLMDIVKAAGLKLVRTDLEWQKVEKKPGVYKFSDYDNLLNLATARGMKILYILGYGNRLYTGGWNHPPVTDASRNAFGNYAKAAATHYAGSPVVFELWNEPNNMQFWQPAPSATEYAALESIGTQQVHAGNRNVLVSTGGLQATASEEVYLKQFLQAGGGGDANMIGMHLYRQWGPESALDDIIMDRYLINQSLSNRPIWATEWGYSSAWFGNGADQTARTMQAQMLARQVLSGWGMGLPLMIYYDLIDDCKDPADEECNFGLVDVNAVDKPAMTALRTLTGAVSGKHFDGNVVTWLNNLHALRFQGSSSLVLVVWSDGNTIRVSLPPGAAPTSVVDYLGNSVTLTYNQGVYSLLVGTTPVYLTFASSSLSRTRLDVPADE